MDWSRSDQIHRMEIEIDKKHQHRHMEWMNTSECMYNASNFDYQRIATGKPSSICNKWTKWFLLFAWLYRREEMGRKLKWKRKRFECLGKKTSEFQLVCHRIETSAVHSSTKVAVTAICGQNCKPQKMSFPNDIAIIHLMYHRNFANACADRREIPLSLLTLRRCHSPSIFQSGWLERFSLLFAIGTATWFRLSTATIKMAGRKASKMTHYTGASPFSG